MALPKLPQGLTADEYEAIFAGTKGVYKGNNKAYYGKSWGDVYAAIYAADVKAGKAGATPYRVALAVESLMFIQGDIGSLVTFLGNFYKITSKSAIPSPHIPGPFDGVIGFLGKLEDPHTWLRVGEGLLGIMLILTAVSKSTGAGSAIGKAARKVPLIV